MVMVVLVVGGETKILLGVMNLVMGGGGRTHIAVS